MTQHKALKPGAFFDLDNTLINGATLLVAAPVLYKEKIIPLPVLLQAMRGSFMFSRSGADESRVDKIKEIALDIFEGRNQKEMFGLIEQHLEGLFRPLMFEDAKRRVKEHDDLEHELVVVSSSPWELVVPIADMFGIKPENVIATQVALDANGCYTREFVQWVSGRAKPGAVKAFAERNGIHLPDSFGYTDSEADLNFLKMFGHPHAVNPDKTLRAHAEENRWPILEFENPARSRNRPVVNALQDHRLLVGAGAAGVTAVGITAGVAIARRQPGVSR